MLSHCSRMCPLKPNDLDNDCPARMRFPGQRDRHDSMRHGCRGRHSKECAQSTTDRKRTRAYFPVLAESGDPRMLDCPAQLVHRACLHYPELRYKSALQPSVRRDRCPIDNRGVRGGWLSCTRNQAQFVESTHAPESATAQGGFLGTPHELALVFLTFAKACAIPGNLDVIVALLSSIPRIGEALLSAAKTSLRPEPQTLEANSADSVRWGLS